MPSVFFLCVTRRPKTTKDCIPVIASKKPCNIFLFVSFIYMHHPTLSTWIHLFWHPQGEVQVVISSFRDISSFSPPAKSSVQYLPLKHLQALSISQRHQESIPQKLIYSNWLNREITNIFGGTRWHSWLRDYATSRKVAGSIPDGVTGIFHWHNPFSRTMALESTQRKWVPEILEK